MTLDKWLEHSWVAKTEPSRAEVANLLSISKREIADAALEGMSADGTFDHAYSAVRTLCHVALHASGFNVPKGARQHERVIESLKFTLGDDWVEDVDYFDRCRRMRHKSLYDSAGIAKPDDAKELLASAKWLHQAVEDWLATNHPQLMSA